MRNENHTQMARILVFLLSTLMLSTKSNAQAISAIQANQVQLSSAILPTIVTLPKSDSLRNRPFTYRDNRIPQPLFVIDGKVATIKKLSKINSQRIANVEVVKAEQGIVRFGLKGENGVIIITMKKY